MDGLLHGFPVHFNSKGDHYPSLLWVRLGIFIVGRAAILIGKSKLEAWVTKKLLMPTFKTHD